MHSSYACIYTSGKIRNEGGSPLFLCPFSHMYTSPAEKVLPTGYICTGMMCAHVVLAAESPLVSTPRLNIYDDSTTAVLYLQVYNISCMCQSACK